MQRTVYKKIKGWIGVTILPTSAVNISICLQITGETLFVYTKSYGGETSSLLLVSNLARGPICES
jgi:hypothetical protein